MLQQNTSKRVKRTPSRENLPALFSLRYFKSAVSYLNILTKRRYLEAKPLLRHLRRGWTSWSSTLQVHTACKFLLYLFSHLLTPRLVPTPHFTYTRKPRTVSPTPLSFSDANVMLTQFQLIVFQCFLRFQIHPWSLNIQLQYVNSDNQQDLLKGKNHTIFYLFKEWTL